VYLERLNREHEDIYNAIARKDAEAARAAMRTHLSNSRERLRRAQEGMAARTPERSRIQLSSCCRRSVIVYSGRNSCVG
jgi:hypothetical protein